MRHWELVGLHVVMDRIMAGFKLYHYGIAGGEDNNDDDDDDGVIKIDTLSVALGSTMTILHSIFVLLPYLLYLTKHHSFIRSFIHSFIRKLFNLLNTSLCK